MGRQRVGKRPEYDIAEVFREIHEENDRAAAITAAAYFEQVLKLAIAARLVELSNTKKDLMFERPSGPLNTFYTRALIGFALGLYGPRTYADLEKIRSVRNEFAHHPGVSSFSHPRICEKCTGLHTAQNVEPTMNPRAMPPGTPRAVYLDSLLEIGARLMRSGPRTRDYQLTVLDNGLL